MLTGCGVACVAASTASTASITATSVNEFRDDQVASALAALLELSELTLEPLRQIQRRALLLGAGAPSLPADAFLAHQARFLAPSLVEWTQELVQPGQVAATSTRH